MTHPTPEPVVMQQRVHELKCWPGEYEEVAAGRKTFEVRRNDRAYMQGDLLLLHEWDDETGAYTGRSLVREVTYLCLLDPFGLDGWAAMQLDHDMAEWADLAPADDAGTAVLETKAGRCPLRLAFDPATDELVVELPDGAGRVRFAAADTAVLYGGTP